MVFEEPRRVMEPPFAAGSQPVVKPSAEATKQRRRVPLKANRRRLSYDLRLRLWLFALSVPPIAVMSFLVWHSAGSLLWALAAAAVLTLFFAVATETLFEQLTRPLQTLSNIVAALRDDDFSFRARGARRGDSLGDLALEINALAGTLQAQRGTARDALTLAERVMAAMRTPVLAFAPEGTLRLLNPAAESAFALRRSTALGQHAVTLGLEPLFRLADGAVHAHPAVSGVAGETRWSLRRSSFRLGGVPHVLFVLSDVQAALREEERVAWQRLVRVLSHEINNSLTPISSLAGSLRQRLQGMETKAAVDPFAAPIAEEPVAGEQIADLCRGLHLIEDRALALHRFLQAYQQLTRLPQPHLKRVHWPALIEGVVGLETRMAVTLEGGPELVSLADPAQIEQLLINLLRNAVEAAQSVAAQADGVRGSAEVSVGWTASRTELTVHIRDNGPGLANTANLFVPFYTTKPDGSGIGLALAQQIASGHGGTLLLTNRHDGQGCIAELHLPLWNESSQQS